MKRRLTLFLLLMASMAFLVGWGKKNVDLLNKSKLIDLSKAIELAKPGGSSGESDIESGSSDEGASISGEQETTEAPKDMIIKVRDQEITYTFGSTVRKLSVAELEKQIRKNASAEMSITLVDDFAEAHLFRDVQDILNNLKSEFGFTYKQDESPESE